MSAHNRGKPQKLPSNFDKLFPKPDTAEHQRHVDAHGAREDRLESQSRAWILAANAAALLLCLSAFLDGKVCDWLVLRPIVLTFVVGLFATYACVMLDRLTLRASAAKWLVLQQIVEQEERRREAEKAIRETPNMLPRLKEDLEGRVKDAAEKRDLYQEVLSKMPSNELINFGGGSAITLLQLVGVGAFGFGLLSAVLDSRYTAAICQQ